MMGWESAYREEGDFEGPPPWSRSQGNYLLAAQAKRRLNQLGGKISAGAPYSWLQFAHATSDGPTLLVTSCQL